MHRFHFFYRFHILLFLALFSGLAVAQRTVVQDAGAGRKIELHYNAANQIVETRTIGADGKVQQKETLEYPPGAYAANTASTTYWPNGQVQRLTSTTYDRNSNFTGESVQVFDESGKQVSGHKLTHVPETNVYKCEDWNAAAKAYKTVQCPAGEGSGHEQETAKQFTAEEANHQLESARKAAPAQAPKAAPSAPAGNNVREVGFVLPARIPTGETLSASVIQDPGQFENAPDLLVTRLALPFAATGAASNLAGWRVEIAGNKPQPADGPIVLNIPRGTTTVDVVFRQADNAGAPVSKTVKLPALKGKKPPNTGNKYLAPAMCMKDDPCVITGRFSGDATKTFAAFEERPAMVLAETADTLLLAVPEQTAAGSRPLVISEGDKAIAWPMVVGEFSIDPERRDVTKDTTQIMYLLLEGAEDIPDSEWRKGSYPASNLEQARKLVPGFQPSTESDHDRHEAAEKHEREARVEKDEDESGEIVVVIKNTTPEVATFREAKNGMFVFHLRTPSFEKGDFAYKYAVDAKQTGTLGVESYVLPFLAPVAGQEFPLATAAK